MQDKEFQVSKKDWNKIKHGLFYERLKKSGYKINTWLIMLGFLIPIGLLLYNGYASGFVEKWMVRCPVGDQPCMNPFYKCDPMTTMNCPDEKTRSLICGANPGFCLMPFIQPGSQFGDTQTFIEKYFFGLTMLSLVFVYGSNHYLYNSKEQRKQRREEYGRDSLSQ